MNQKDICIISPSLKAGGIERALTLLANEFVEREVNVVFISCLVGKEHFILDKRITIVKPDFERKTGIFNKLITYIKMLFFIRKTVKHFAPKSILAYGDYFAPMVLLSLVGVNIPVYISDRMNPSKIFPLIIRISKKYLYPRATGFIAQTNKSLKINNKRYGNKLRYKIIPNAVRSVVPKQLNKKNNIVCVARLHPEKGLDRALKVLSKLKNQNFELHIAGGGSTSQKQSLQRLAKHLNIESRVVFRGEIKDIDVFLSESKIFILTSYSEGFPNALCEAMSNGLLCITFKDLNDSEIITKNGFDGFLVEDNNIDKMAEIVDYCILNYDSLRHIRENALMITERLNSQKISNRVLDFITQNDN